MDIFDTLISDFHNSSGWLELGVLFICLGLAYGITHRAGRDHAPTSVWFGRNTFDGLMFPLLALVLVYASNSIVSHYQPVFLLRLAVPMLLSLVIIRLIARVLSSAFPNSALMQWVERLVSWLAWAAAVLWILGLLPQVMDEMESVHLSFGKTSVTLLTIIEGTLSAGLMMVVVLWISSAFETRVINQAVTDLSMRKVAMNITRTLLITIGLLFSLSAVGVDLTALSVLGGAVGVGLGFGMQKIASNYVSGFLVLIERALRIGDNVRVDGFEGRITDIKTRFTVIRASNGRESIVPNETLITQRVENLTRSDRKFNMTTNIVVGSDSDVAQVQAILCAAAAAQPRVLTTSPPVAYLVNFAPDGLEFSLNFWISDPEAGQANVRSAVNIALLEGLRAARIDIPYPQRVLQLADGAALSIQQTGAAPQEVQAAPVSAPVSAPAPAALPSAPGPTV